MKKLLLATMLSSMICVPITAFAAASVNDAPDTSKSFFENAEEGWFWYKDEKAPEPVDPKNPEQEGKSPPQGPPAFSVAWLRDNIPRYRDMAIDNPTIENVRAFLMIQRVMLDKAENFARAMQMVVVGDELVDETMRRGFSTLAANQIDRQSEKAEKDLLKVLADRIGIFFFFDSTCNYCKAQVPILENFMNMYDFSVLGISVDGNPMPEGMPFDWKIDKAGLAERFGVDTFPAMVLVDPEGQSQIISMGILSLTELQQRTILASKQMGWISQEEFNSTVPITNPEKNDLAKALEAKTDKAKKILQSYQNSDGFIDQDKLIQLVTMRAKYTNTSLSNKKSIENAAKEVKALKEIAKTPKEIPNAE